MKKTCLILMGLIAAGTGSWAQTSRLVDSEWLQNHLKNGKLVILHVGQSKDYENEHIDGAVLIEPTEFTYKDEVRTFDLPTNEVLKSVLEKKGISNDTDVVLYTPTNWISIVTRLYFTLDYLGHGNKTYILDGGMINWKANRGKTSTQATTMAQGSFKVKPNDSLVADKEYVLSSIKDDKVNIIDCRASVYYSGIEPSHNARHGRVPTAKTIPYTTVCKETSTGAYVFKSVDEISRLFEAQGLSKDKDIVLYCHIGMQLTVVYTAAQMLGYENIKIYDGSFHEWGPDESLPIELD